MAPRWTVALIVLPGVALLTVGARPAAADTTTSLGTRSGEGSTPFTGLAHTPVANLFTGPSGTGIKIELPPGRKNVTPNLVLQYSSSGGPSPTASAGISPSAASSVPPSGACRAPAPGRTPTSLCSLSPAAASN